MAEGQSTALRPSDPRATERVAGAFLIALMAIGSLFLWVGVPPGCLWLSSKLTSSAGAHFLLDLPVTVLAMVILGYFLIWLNGLYLRVTGVIAYYESEQEELGPDAVPRYLRGPLETLLVSSLVLALIALFVWFFLLAHNPSASSVF